MRRIVKEEKEEGVKKKTRQLGHQPHFFNTPPKPTSYAPLTPRHVSTLSFQIKTIYRATAGSGRPCLDALSNHTKIPRLTPAPRLSPKSGCSAPLIWDTYHTLLLI